MTNNEVNEAVARKLGWWNFDIGVGGTPEDKALDRWDGKLIGSAPPKRVNAEMVPVPAYSTSIAAAFEIAKSNPTHGDLHFQLTFFYSGYKDGIGHGPIWWAGWQREHFRGGNSDDTIYSTAELAPLAICLAFLKLPA